MSGLHLPELRQGHDLQDPDLTRPCPVEYTRSYESIDLHKE